MHGLKGNLHALPSNRNASTAAPFDLEGFDGLEEFVFADVPLGNEQREEGQSDDESEAEDGAEEPGPNGAEAAAAAAAVALPAYTAEAEAQAAAAAVAWIRRKALHPEPHH